MRERDVAIGVPVYFKLWFMKGKHKKKVEGYGLIVEVEHDANDKTIARVVPGGYWCSARELVKG